MARDASSSGDRIAAENYFQHAEHYYRILAVQREEAEARAAASQQSQRSNGNENGSGRRSRQDQPQETAGYGTEAPGRPEVEGSEMPAFVTKKVPEASEKTSEESKEEEAKAERAVGND